MITNTLISNQLSDDAYAWYRAYLQAVDDRNIDAYAVNLADGISIQFNNDDPIVGKAAVVAMLGGYWQGFASLEHELLNIYGTDQAFVLEALNHYVRHDGKPVTTRAVAFTDRNEDGLVTSVRVYADVSPVFAD